MVVLGDTGMRRSGGFNIPLAPPRWCSTASVTDLRFAEQNRVPTGRLSPLLETWKSRNLQSIDNPSRFEMCTHKRKREFVRTHLNPQNPLRASRTRREILKRFSMPHSWKREQFMRHAPLWCCKFTIFAVLCQERS